jgi:hypothetical protein
VRTRPSLEPKLSIAEAGGGTAQPGLADVPFWGERRTSAAGAVGMMVTLTAERRWGRRIRVVEQLVQVLFFVDVGGRVLSPLGASVP